MAERLADLQPNSQLKVSPKKNRRKRRGSFSAESYNPDAKVDKVFHAKSEQDREFIRESVKQNFLFRHLDDEQAKLVIDAMESKNVLAGVSIIQQGDDGDFFYIVAEGEFDITKSTDGGPPEKLIVVGPGGSFGELALMYNAPRAATCTAIGACKVWALDRVTFNHVVMDTTIKRRRKYEEFLASVPALSVLTRHEVSRLADVLIPQTFEDGERIVKQGEAGEIFFIVESGEAAVVVTRDEVPLEVATLGEKDYFGEITLLDDVPRTATVTAVGPCSVVAVDHANFIRLLESCTEVFRENIANYKTYDDVLAEKQREIEELTQAQEQEQAALADLADEDAVVIGLESDAEDEIPVVPNGSIEDPEWIRVHAEGAVENGAAPQVPADDSYLSVVTTYLPEHARFDNILSTYYSPQVSFFHPMQRQPVPQLQYYHSPPRMVTGPAILPMYNPMVGGRVGFPQPMPYRYGPYGWGMGGYMPFM